MRAGSLARRAVDLPEKACEPEPGALFQTAPAVWHALMGHVAEARCIAAQVLDMSTGREVSYSAAFALAMTGELSRSQALLKDLEARFPQDTTVNISYVPALRGLIALQQGNRRKHSRSSSRSGERIRFARHGILRQLWKPVSGLRARPDVSGRRKPADAAIEFRKIISDRGLVMEDPVDAVARLQLARALAASEDTAGARAAYQDSLSTVEAGRHGRSALEAGTNRSGEASAAHAEDQGPLSPFSLRQKRG